MEKKIMNRKEFLLKTAGLLILSGASLAVFSQEPEEKKKKYTVIAKRCDGCGHCFRSCRDKALLVTETGKAYIDSEKCKGCGDCTRFCRRMAIVECKNE
jgi:MinD superfamily P-loop ATPase